MSYGSRGVERDVESERSDLRVRAERGLPRSETAALKREDGDEGLSQ